MLFERKDLLRKYKRIKSNKISKVDKANRIKGNKKGQKVYYKLNLTTVQMQ